MASITALGGNQIFFLFGLFHNLKMAVVIVEISVCSAF